MLSSRTCPDDAELLAVASGEEPWDALRARAHLAAWSNCSERLDRLRHELAVLRERAPEAPLSPSTASGPASDPATASGRADHADSTAPSQIDLQPGAIGRAEVDIEPADTWLVG
jgi:hypothetical protein